MQNISTCRKQKSSDQPKEDHSLAPQTEAARHAVNAHFDREDRTSGSFLLQPCLGGVLSKITTVFGAGSTEEQDISVEGRNETVDGLQFVVYV